MSSAVGLRVVMSGSGVDVAVSVGGRGVSVGDRVEVAVGRGNGVDVRVAVGVAVTVSRMGVISSVGSTVGELHAANNVIKMRGNKTMI